MLNLGVNVIEELGRGSSGRVFKVQHKENGQYYVLKLIDLGLLPPEKQNRAQKEVEILSKINHPHVIKYFDSIIQGRKLYILMEYAPNGDLQNYISNSKSNKTPIEEKQIWKWGYEVCLGLKYLHSHNVMHRDLKCMNILLDRKNRLKIGDLGLSKIFEEKELHASNVGTPMYLSPEQVRNQPYDLKVDIWGLGCILYNLAALEPPFKGDNLISLGKNIVSKVPKPLPQKFSPQLVNLITALLRKNPKMRPNICGVIDCFPYMVKKLYTRPERPVKPRNADYQVTQPAVSPSSEKESFVNKIKKNSSIRLRFRAVETRPLTSLHLRSNSCSSRSNETRVPSPSKYYLPTPPAKPKHTIKDLAKVM